MISGSSSRRARNQHTVLLYRLPPPACNTASSEERSSFAGAQTSAAEPSNRKHVTTTSDASGVDRRALGAFHTILTFRILHRRRCSQPESCSRGRSHERASAADRRAVPSFAVVS